MRDYFLLDLAAEWLREGVLDCVLLRRGISFIFFSDWFELLCSFERFSIGIFWFVILAELLSSRSGIF